MFEQDKTPKATRENETVIGSLVKVKGTLSAEGNVTVKGEMEGTIKTRNDLRIEQGAHVKGDVRAKNIFIAGELQGNIATQERTRMAASARILGDLETKFLAIEEGAAFNGRCNMGETIRKEEKKEEAKK